MNNNSTVERRLYILKLLEKNEKVNVNTLSKQFGVSEVTIRKDLRHLEKKNMLIRAHGEAIKQSLVNVDLSIYDRRKQNIKSKQAIGIKAVSLIGNGETILLDSGTTIMELVKHLPKQIEITVITNAVDIAFQLAEYPKIRVIMPGGILRRNSLSLVGEQAAEAFRNYYCNKCFVSADGIDKQQGLLTMNIEEAHLSRINMENSRKVIALIDSSKFQQKGMMTIVPISKINTLITDNGISGEQKKYLADSGIEVLIANE